MSPQHRHERFIDALGERYRSARVYTQLGNRRAQPGENGLKLTCLQDQRISSGENYFGHAAADGKVDGAAQFCVRRIRCTVEVTAKAVPTMEVASACDQQEQPIVMFLNHQGMRHAPFFTHGIDDVVVKTLKLCH